MAALSWSPYNLYMNFEPEATCRAFFLTLSSVSEVKPRHMGAKAISHSLLRLDGIPAYTGGKKLWVYNNLLPRLKLWGSGVFSLLFLSEVTLAVNFWQEKPQSHVLLTYSGYP